MGFRHRINAQILHTQGRGANANDGTQGRIEGIKILQHIHGHTGNLY